MAEEKDWKTQWCEEFDGRQVTIDGEELLQSKKKKFIKINVRQYELLLHCSQEKSIVSWNEYRKNNPDKEIWLSGANLQEAELQYANLQDANLEDANLQGVKLWVANLQGACLSYANLQGTDLFYANLQGAHLPHANLQDAYLVRANLQEAELQYANLQDANLEEANLQGTNLSYANLQDAHLENANLQGTNLQGAILHGSKLTQADIEKAKFYNIKFNSETDFTGSNLDSAFIEPNTKGGLEYNIRRLGWRNWYEKGYGPKRLKKRKWLWKIIKLPTRWFWSVSNYGISSLRIIFWFMSFSFVFAYIYWRWPEMLNYTSGTSDSPLIHNLYFSIVTMTTLGFGDIHANPKHQWGQFVLIAQVLMGYGFLGALVTRLGVVFTGLGPVEKPKLAPTESLVSKLGGWLPIILAVVAIPCIEAVKICHELGFKVLAECYNLSAECLTILLCFVIFISSFFVIFRQRG